MIATACLSTKVLVGCHVGFARYSQVDIQNWSATQLNYCRNWRRNSGFMVRHLFCCLAHIDFARFPVIRRFFAERCEDTSGAFHPEKKSFICIYRVGNTALLGSFITKVRACKLRRCSVWDTPNVSSEGLWSTGQSWPAIWFLNYTVQPVEIAKAKPPYSNIFTFAKARY